MKFGQPFVLITFPLYSNINFVITFIMQDIGFLVSSCDDLTCEENEICVAAGDTYECACHPDYEGENCEETGLFFDV